MGIQTKRRQNNVPICHRRHDGNIYNSIRPNVRVTLFPPAILCANSTNYCGYYFIRRYLCDRVVFLDSNERELSKMKTLIFLGQVITVAGIAYILASAGLGVFSWQFWAIMGLIVLVRGLDGVDTTMR